MYVWHRLVFEIKNVFLFHSWRRQSFSLPIIHVELFTDIWKVKILPHAQRCHKDLTMQTGFYFSQYSSVCIYENYNHWSIKFKSTNTGNKNDLKCYFHDLRHGPFRGVRSHVTLTYFWNDSSYVFARVETHQCTRHDRIDVIGSIVGV